VSNEQALSELKQAIESPEAQTDIRGVVLHWLMVTGQDASVLQRRYGLKQDETPEDVVWDWKHPIRLAPTSSVPGSVPKGAP
jgi:hypothetical protein